ncbi:MAG: sigma-54-dependent Fis family transcriptional regulator [Nitrospira sp.]|nr:sigma-54-dependent Fis family transcriptional regulator [Nitrospira sp.]
MLSPPATVLVVDDARHLRQSLAQLFSTNGYRVLEAADGNEALAVLASQQPDVILLDLNMPLRDGLSTLAAIKADPSTHAIPVVILTSFGGSDQTITAMKTGAYDYITKPFDMDQLLHMVTRAAEVYRLSRELDRLRASQPAREPDHNGLIGHHATMREIFKMIGKVASSTATVLITGESGTGKELIARAIHQHSARASFPLITVNCAAIPEGLLESELFGHEKGAFTGALQLKPGRFEEAAGGTVFLDEIGELPVGLQGKLLRVLQEHTFERLGGTHALHVDFRIVAATNRNLRQLVEEGRFREDLFYRLDVVQIEAPPLRARRSDIPELADHFLHQYQATGGKEGMSFDDDALRLLMLYPYPGNVRELEHVIQRAVLLSPGPLITREHLPELTGETDSESRDSDLQKLLTLPLEEATRALERILITRALTRGAGNKSEAARILGIHRQTLYAKLDELGLREVE